MVRVKFFQELQRVRIVVEEPPPFEVIYGFPYFFPDPIQFVDHLPRPLEGLARLHDQLSGASSVCGLHT